MKRTSKKNERGQDIWRKKYIKAKAFCTQRRKDHALKNISQNPKSKIMKAHGGKEAAAETG